MIRGARPTARGWMVMLIGVLTVCVAAGIGEPDLVWVGLFLLVLPLLSLALVLLFRPKLRYTREIHPSQITVGEDAETVVRLSNVNAMAATSLELVDEAPSSLGGGARFVVARAFGRWDQAVKYQMRSDQRGRFLVGPLKAKAGDPLGLARVNVRPRGDSTLIRVTPKIWPLASVARGVGHGATGESSPHRTGTAGQDDVLVREHRHGDDIRRVHWRMTAKQGELMVRLEEHPWDPSALIITDTRQTRHVGAGPESSLEWVISAATSLAVKLSDERHRIVIAGGSGTIFEPRQLKGPAQRQAIVDAMTDVGASDEPDLRAIFAESDSLDATGSLVFFGGLLTVQDAATLAGIGQRMSKPCAIVMDPDAWQTSASEHHDALHLLHQHGWAVERYSPGSSCTEVWARTMLRQAAA